MRVATVIPLSTLTIACAFSPDAALANRCDIELVGQPGATAEQGLVIAIEPDQRQLENAVAATLCGAVARAQGEDRPPRAFGYAEAKAERPQQRLEDVRGKLLPPVGGTLVCHFGERDRKGRPSDGVAWRTKPCAPVRAPFDSTTMFAQPYRGHEQVLILSTGDGYHLTLAGMTKIYGVEGQKLLEGEPVGIMGVSEEVVQVPDVPLAAGTGNAPGAEAGPELYFEIRHNSKPINPLPWLATTRLERTSP